MSELQALNNGCFDLHQEEEKQEPFDSNLVSLRTIHSPCPTCGCCSAPSPPSSATKRGSPDSKTAEVNDRSSQKQKKQKKHLVPDHHTPLHTITTAIPSSLCRRIPDPTEFGNDSVSADATNRSLNVVDTPQSKQIQYLPPRPQPLRRTVSDPSNIISQSTIDKGRENAQYLRLKKMKEYMEEMTKWWDKILPEKEKEEEEEWKQEQENGKDKAVEEICPKALKDESMTNGEETVSVERVGESMIVHFKCPCGKSYQILVSRGKCYYMLM